MEERIDQLKRLREAIAEEIRQYDRHTALYRISLERIQKLDEILDYMQDKSETILELWLQFYGITPLK